MGFFNKQNKGRLECFLVFYRKLWSPSNLIDFETTMTSALDKNDTTLVVSFLVVFFLAIIGTGYVAHRHARFEPIREAVRDRLLVMRPARGLGEEAVGKIPVVRFSDHNRSDKTLASNRRGRQDMPIPPAAGASTTVSTLLWFQSLKAMRPVRIDLPRSGTRRRAEMARERIPSSCSICAEDYSEGEELRKLPCGHVFHKACVDPWLRDRARTCPLWYDKTLDFGWMENAC